MSTPSDLIHVSFLRVRFWRAYVVLMRPYLLFVSGITGIVGLAFVPQVPLLRLLLLSLVFFLSYGFGQALTDCFQMDTDALSSPYRPLVQGIVHRRDVMVVSYAGLLMCGLIIGIYNIRAMALALLCVVGLATYTYFKRRWWAGPFYNAWIVAVLFLIALVSGGATEDIVRRPVVLFTVSAVFFGYANFVLAGYFKDISADRATGYNTLPVRFGQAPAAIVSDVFAALTLGSCGIALYLTLSTQSLSAIHLPALLFAVVGAVLSIIAQVRLHRTQEDHEAHGAIKLVVHAYVLLLSAVAAFQQPGWAPVLLLFYVAFVITLRLRPMAQQI